MRACLTAAMLIVLLAACGGGGGASSTATVAATATSAPAIATATSAPSPTSTATATATTAASPTATSTVAATATAAASPTPSGPPAAELACGDEIAESVTLANDLTCDGAALFVTGDGVTLDLGGHTLTGPGPGTRSWPLPKFDVGGVTVRGDNVTLRNGTINAFGLAVLVQEAQGATIEDVTAEGSYYGIYLYRGGGHHVERCVVDDNTYGLHLQDSNDNVVLDNRLTRQTHHSPGGYGLYLFSSERNRFEGNTIADNINWGLWFSESPNNLIVRNNVIGNDPQVSDDVGGNIYYDEATKEGNYWADYQGADANGDGVGDEPYTIGGPGRSADLYPFMTENGWATRDSATLKTATPPPPPDRAPRAYLELADGSVAAVDPASSTLLGVWPVGVSQPSIATSFDGAKLYVIAGEGADARVLELDTASGAVLRSWSVPDAQVVAAMYDGARVIVSGPETMTEIVLATNELRPQPDGGGAVSLTPSWKHNLVLASDRNGTVSVIYLPFETSPYQMPLPGAPVESVDNHSGTLLYTLVEGQPDVLLIDTEQFAITARVPLGDIDPTQARLAPSPDGTTLYLLDRATGRVVAIDLGTQQITHSATVDGAVDIAISADGAYLTVAATLGNAGQATILDADLAFVDWLKIPAAPASVVAPR